jgi:hypothetical protein
LFSASISSGLSVTGFCGNPIAKSCPNPNPVGKLYQKTFIFDFFASGITGGAGGVDAMTSQALALPAGSTGGLHEALFCSSLMVEIDDRLK